MCVCVCVCTLVPSDVMTDLNQDGTLDISPEKGCFSAIEGQNSKDNINQTQYKSNLEVDDLTESITKQNKNTKCIKLSLSSQRH